MKPCITMQKGIMNKREQSGSIQRRVLLLFVMGKIITFERSHITTDSEKLNFKQNKINKLQKINERFL